MFSWPEKFMSHFPFQSLKIIGDRIQCAGQRNAQFYPWLPSVFALLCFSSLFAMRKKRKKNVNAGGSGSQSQAQLHSKFKASQEFVKNCLKQQQQKQA